MLSCRCEPRKAAIKIMNANQVPVGYYFIGFVFPEDWAGNNRDFFPGDKIKIVLLIPHNDAREESSMLMNLYASLKNENPLQLCNGFSKWVCGARLKRSKYVQIHDWRNPNSIDAAEKISLQISKSTT
jgi:hypothetical protein